MGEESLLFLSMLMLLQLLFPKVPMPGSLQIDDGVEVCYVRGELCGDAVG